MENSSKMDSEQRYWITIVSVICVTIITIALVIGGYYYSTDKYFVDNGFEQQVQTLITGQENKILWVKKADQTKK